MAEEGKEGKLGGTTSERDGEVGRQTSTLKQKKRNNFIDILKAGGTRILLFLLFKDILT